MESQFFEPPRELTKIDSKNGIVREIGGKITGDVRLRRRYDTSRLVRVTGKFEKVRVQESGIPQHKQNSIPNVRNKSRVYGKVHEV